jgi:hypothetical protein
VDVYSAYQYDGTPDQFGLITLNTRLAEHSYTGVGIQTSTGFNGTYTGTAIASSSLNIYGESCSGASVSVTVSNYVITGTAKDPSGDVLNLTGTVLNDGSVDAGVGVGTDTIVRFSGKISGTTINGTWQEIYGCKGTWTAIKR